MSKSHSSHERHPSSIPKKSKLTQIPVAKRARAALAQRTQGSSAPRASSVSRSRHQMRARKSCHCPKAGKRPDAVIARARGVTAPQQRRAADKITLIAHYSYAQPFARPPRYLCARAHTLARGPDSVYKLHRARESGLRKL